LDEAPAGELRQAGAARPLATGADLLRGLAPDDLLLQAAETARRAGVMLIDAVAMEPGTDIEAMVRGLGERLGVATLTDADPLPATGGSPDGLASAMLRMGVMRLADGRILAAARGPALACLNGLLRAGGTAERIVLATPQRFVDTVLAQAGATLAKAASRTLDTRRTLSARDVGRGGWCPAWLGLFLAFGGLAVLGLSAEGHVVLSVGFLALAAVRCLAIFATPPRRRRPARRPDDGLPVYTVLVPLYREGRQVPGILGALEALDYPRAKLDIKILLEAEDEETRVAVACSPLARHVEILRMPPGEVRTKPRALNFGLFAARGDYLVIYDAEDRPAPGQLRAALDAFARGGERLACVQARLVIDNTDDGQLTRLFTIEYAALFDVLIPALAAGSLLFPLGGTSNHFRTAVLRDAGGWDAWNVTEDADLGVRLRRLGFGLDAIDSITLEEAPNTIGSWVRQRTRWLKGYMLTWWVHMRTPLALLRELGPLDFFLFHALIGGVPLAALAYPIFLVSFALGLAAQDWLVFGTGRLLDPLGWFDLLNILIGFGAAGALGRRAVRRGGLLRLTPSLFLLPFYWLLISAAGFRAIYQLATAPYRWEKTQHGVARTSRTGGRRYIQRLNSSATSVSRRLRLRGATKRPDLSIR
jgi:hypothetical protein